MFQPVRYQIQYEDHISPVKYRVLSSLKKQLELDLYLLDLGMATVHCSTRCYILFSAELQPEIKQDKAYVSTVFTDVVNNLPTRHYYVITWLRPEGVITIWVDKTLDELTELEVTTLSTLLLNQ